MKILPHVMHGSNIKMTQIPLTLPRLPCKVRLLLSILTVIIDTVRHSNGTVNRRLMNLFDFKAAPSNKPNNLINTSDVMVDPSRNLWFRLYIPTTTTAKLPLIIYFHGGGFAFFSANSKPYDDLCKRLAHQLPATVLSVNYRLAPEHRYPSQYEDGFDVLKFIDTTTIPGLDPNSIDITRCFLAGDSAGGNLALHVAIKASDHVFHKMRIIGLIGLQPFFGGKQRTESETRLAKGLAISLEQTDWYWEAFLPEGAGRDHAAANVFGPEWPGDGLGATFPATIVFVGGFDPLQDWQRRYVEGLKKYSGKESYLIEYPNSFHGFYAFADLKESSLLINEVKDFIQKQSA